MLVLKKSEFFHSKDKSHNYSICVFNFSRKDILDRHANHFHEDKMSKNPKVMTFLKLVNLKEHTEPVHIKNRSNNSSICDHNYFKKQKCK